MNNYLHGLPFHKDAKNLSSCQCLKQGFDPPSFKLYTQEDRLPTFSLRLPPVGAMPDITYANECIFVQSCDGTAVARITMLKAGFNLLKDTNSYFLIYDGRKIAGLKLECGKCYRMKISNNYSEVFWVTSTPSEKIRIEFANNSQLGDVPYQASGFTQKILIDGEICALDAELFENRKEETNGKQTISFQRMTLRKGLSVFNAPDFVQQLLSSARLHDTFRVIQHGDEYVSLPKQMTVTSTSNGCCDYDLEVIIPTREIKIQGGVCQSDADGTLVTVDIPDDLPDSCDVENTWEPTDTTICLRLGEVPPPVDPPIGGGITPPPPTCAPSGFVISQNAETVPDCLNAWPYNGQRYKRKITKVIADGNCGQTSEISYLEPCTAVTHTLEGITCGDTPTCEPDGTLIRTDAESVNNCDSGWSFEGKVYKRKIIKTLNNGLCGTRLSVTYEDVCLELPPVGTPPVGTPPVGTPPVGTPSGILLYARNESALTSIVGDVPKVGQTYTKPTPYYDFSFPGFGGATFNKVIAYYRLKVNNSYEQMHMFSITFSGNMTALSASDWSLFKGTALNMLHPSIFASGNQEWQLEIVGLLNNTNVGTREAKFAFQSALPNNIQARVVSHGHPDNMTITKTREGAGWRIKDVSPLNNPQNGYENRYFLNEFEMNTGNAKLDIFWPADTELMIQKVHPKLGLDTLNKWECGRDPGYYDCDAAKAQPYNNSVSQVTLTFND